MFNEGESVSVIHDVIRGKVVAVNGTKITIEDSDGFIRYYRSNELAKQVINDYNVDTVVASEFIEDKAELVPKSIKTVGLDSDKKILSKSPINSNEIDLHIEVLMPEAVYWSTSEILQKQMIACRAFIEKSVAHKINPVILIHGKGEGVLKSEIYHYLNRIDEQLHVNISYHDADFRTFGTGATQVNFKY